MVSTFLKCGIYKKGGFTMTKNKIASALKIGSIVVFVIAIFGAIAISQETVGEYYWEKETLFDATLFFTTAISSALPCVLIYGLGELIQINHDNRYYLANLAKEKIENTEQSKEQ